MDLIEIETARPGTDVGTVISDWEAAYCRFETPAQEVRKFLRRLRWFGAHEWPKDAQVVDLFCGRGNGLVALQRLGFRHVEGVDLSSDLLNRYQGPATVYHADCRNLPFEDGSRDVVTINGGLHHLECLPADLIAVLDEIRRILRPDGKLAIVEPWQTPFLALVDRACRVATLRGLWPKLDALAVMTELELTTYQAWLSQPRVIRDLLERGFEPLRCREHFGKLWFLGRKRS